MPARAEVSWENCWTHLKWSNELVLLLCCMSWGWGIFDLVLEAPVVTPLMLNSTFLDAAACISTCRVVLPIKTLGLRLCHLCGHPSGDCSMLEEHIHKWVPTRGVEGWWHQQWGSHHLAHLLNLQPGTARWRNPECHHLVTPHHGKSNIRLAIAKSEGCAEGRALQRTLGSCYNWMKTFLLPPIMDRDLRLSLWVLMVKYYVMAPGKSTNESSFNRLFCSVPYYLI